METPTTPKWMTWAGWVLTGLFTLFLLFDSIIKVMRHEMVLQTMAAMELPDTMAVPIGVIELISLALLLFPRTAVLGAVLFTGVFGGAIASHWRLGDPLLSHTLFGVYLGVVMWGGLWLRDARLRSLMPWRR